LIAVFASPLARILDTVRPNETDWLVIILCTVMPVLVVEATKLIRKLKTTHLQIDGTRTLSRSNS
jgi:hypothetical protein